MGRSLAHQAERLYDAFAELVRAYQFRDREEVCCHGLSVSQCYALDALVRHGPSSMSDLAGRLYLESSTMTRVVDELVAQRLALRVTDSKDRRVCRVQVTRKGSSLLARIRAELIAQHEKVLQAIPFESREAVIAAVSELLAAFRERCAHQPNAAVESGDRKQCEVG